MKIVDPSTFFDGPLLVAAPHMDDAVIGCGGTLLRLADPGRVRLVYACDGRGMFREAGARRAPVLDEDINRTRKRETACALDVLGIRPEQATFLDFADWRLRQRRVELQAALQAHIEAQQPAAVLTPFRLDKHPDHIALNRGVRAAARACGNPPVFEYFVYYQWKLLPRRDIRRHIRPEALLRVDLEAVSAAKRRALDCFTSQITRFHPVQHRPVLSNAMLQDFAGGPEYLLDAGSATPLFDLPLPLIHAVHQIEPAAKWIKEWTRFVCYHIGRVGKNRELEEANRS